MGLSFYRNPIIVLMLILITILFIGLAKVFAPWLLALRVSGGDEVNVGVIKKACLKQCNYASEYNFCNVTKKLIYVKDEEIVFVEGSCDELKSVVGFECSLNCSDI